MVAKSEGAPHPAADVRPALLVSEEKILTERAQGAVRRLRKPASGFAITSGRPPPRSHAVPDRSQPRYAPIMPASMAGSLSSRNLG